MFLESLMFLKDTRSFWDKTKDALSDLWKEILDIFVVIKENTYDLLCNFLDPNVVNLLLVALAIIVVMLVAVVVINK